MIHNLYLILVVGLRGLSLWLVVRPLFGFLFAALLEFSEELPPFISHAPPVGCGLLLWFLAKPIATLMTRDLE